MAKNSDCIVNDEYTFVIELLYKYRHLSDKKIEFIKQFRGESGYGLLESKNLIESYIGTTYKSIYQILSEIDIPRRPSTKPAFDIPNPSKPEKYLITSKNTGGRTYVAESKEEAKRFAAWLIGQSHEGVKTYLEVTL